MALVVFQEDSDIVKKGDSCLIELPNFKGYEPDYTEPNREEIKKTWGQLADAECSVVFDFEVNFVPGDIREKVKNMLLGVYHSVAWFTDEEETVVIGALAKYHHEKELAASAEDDEEKCDHCGKPYCKEDGGVPTCCNEARDSFSERAMERRLQQ